MPLMDSGAEPYKSGSFRQIQSLEARPASNSAYSFKFHAVCSSSLVHSLRICHCCVLGILVNVFDMTDT